MLKLNPYAKTARRHAILKHNPEVGHSTETGNMYIYCLCELRCECVVSFLIDQGKDAEVQEEAQEEGSCCQTQGINQFLTDQSSVTINRFNKSIGSHLSFHILGQSP